MKKTAFPVVCASRGPGKAVHMLNLIKFLTKHHDKRRLFMNFGGDVEVIFKDTEIIGVNNFDGGLYLYLE